MPGSSFRRLFEEITLAPAEPTFTISAITATGQSATGEAQVEAPREIDIAALASGGIGDATLDYEAPPPPQPEYNLDIGGEAAAGFAESSMSGATTQYGTPPAQGYASLFNQQRFQRHPRRLLKIAGMATPGRGFMEVENIPPSTSVVGGVASPGWAYSFMKADGEGDEEELLTCAVALMEN